MISRNIINLIHIVIAILLLCINLVNKSSIQKVVYYGLITLSLIVILYQGSLFLNSYSNNSLNSYRSFINLFHMLIGMYLIYISFINLRNFDSANFVIVQRILTLFALMMISIHTYLYMSRNF